MIPPSLLSLCDIPKIRGDKNEDLVYLVVEQQAALYKCNANISYVRMLID